MITFFFQVTAYFGPIFRKAKKSKTTVVETIDSHDGISLEPSTSSAANDHDYITLPKSQCENNFFLLIFLILSGFSSVVCSRFGMESALDKQKRAPAVRSGNRKTTSIGDVAVTFKSFKEFFDQSNLLNPEKMMTLLKNHWQREHKYSPKVSDRDFHSIPLRISEDFWWRLQRRSEKRNESVLIAQLAESIDKMAIIPFGKSIIIAPLFVDRTTSNHLWSKHYRWL